MAGRLRIGIFFDLDESALKKYYPNKYYNQAWADIKRFMESRDFIHQQYSGYISKNYMTQFRAQTIVKDMAFKYPWLQECLKECVMTTVGREFDLKKYIHGLWQENEPLPEDENQFADSILDAEDEDEMEL